jgi:hypothetical protein
MVLDILICFKSMCCFSVFLFLAMMAAAFFLVGVGIKIVRLTRLESLGSSPPRRILIRECMYFSVFSVKQTDCRKRLKIIPFMSRIDFILGETSYLRSLGGRSTRAPNPKSTNNIMNHDHNTTTDNFRPNTLAGKQTRAPH